MSAPESAKTNVALIPSTKTPFIFEFERQREFTWERQKPTTTPAVVYTTISSYVSSGSSIPSTTVVPIPQTPIVQPKILSVSTKLLAVGTTVTPLSGTQRNTRRVTILASSANTGTIWIVGGPSGTAGFGFPLVAGAAKDLGQPEMTDATLNLTNIYVVGTDPADTVYVSEEYV